MSNVVSFSFETKHKGKIAACCFEHNGTGCDEPGRSFAINQILEEEVAFSEGQLGWP